jgi:hypothetical protein
MVLERDAKVDRNLTTRLRWLDHEEHTEVRLDGLFHIHFYLRTVYISLLLLLQVQSIRFSSMNESITAPTKSNECVSRYFLSLSSPHLPIILHCKASWGARRKFPPTH